MPRRNKQAFQSTVSDIDWEALYISGNAQESFSRFHSTLLKLFNKHFPKQAVKQKYKTRKWWLSESLKESIKTKNKLHVKWLKVNTTANEVTYKNYRNKLNHVLKYAERKYFQDIVDKNKHDIKKTWQIFKSIVNENKRAQVNSKFKLNNGSFITDKAIISSNSMTFLSILGQIWQKKFHLKIYPHFSSWETLFEIAFSSRMLLLRKWIISFHPWKMGLLDGKSLPHKW